MSILTSWGPTLVVPEGAELPPYPAILLTRLCKQLAPIAWYAYIYDPADHMTITIHDRRGLGTTPDEAIEKAWASQTPLAKSLLAPQSSGCQCRSWRTGPSATSYPPFDLSARA